MLAKKLDGSELRPSLGKHLVFALNCRNPSNDKNPTVSDMKPLLSLLRQFFRPVIRREFIRGCIWIQNLGTHHIANIRIQVCPIFYCLRNVCHNDMWRHIRRHSRF